MLLLHTSDWHLGRSLHRADLGAAQAAFLDQLVDTVREERVDAVLVAGDVYDRAVPPVESVGLLEDALSRLRAAGAQVIVSSGNHDSARRLGFGGRLLANAGVHLRTRVDQIGCPVELSDAFGPVSIFGIPYLEPDAVRAELTEEGEPPPRGHTGVLTTATARVRAAHRGGRSVVLAHAWVAGGAGSDSERDIAVGGVGVVPAGLFAGFDYVALGHLHGPQLVTDRVRYSGSPLPYSFSEAGHRKGSWLLDLGASGLQTSTFVPAPTHRRLSSLRGRLDDLMTSRRYDEVTADYLNVIVTDTARPEEAMARLSSRFPHVLVLRHEPEGAAVRVGSYAERVRGRSDLEIAMSFVEHVRRSPAEAGERALLARAFEVCRGRLVELDLAKSSSEGCGEVPPDVAAEVA